MNLDRKHRPKNWDEFVGNEKIVKDLKSLLKTGDMPHLMFVGPPGTGKTTAELLIAQEYLGRPISINTQKGDPDFVVYNGSDARGIDVVRKDIKIKAKTRSQTYKDGVRLKRIIVMREIDNMTKDAQHSLRDIIEVYEDRCLFIFTLNRIGGIQEPALISRCLVRFFKRPTTIQSSILFLNICKKENVVLEDPNMALDVAKYYRGDLRHMLNDCLEVLRGFENPITKEELWQVYEQNAKGVAERVNYATNHRQKFFEIYKTEGFDLRHFLEEYYDLMGDKAIPHSEAFALIDSRLRDKCSETVQMGYFFTLIEG